MILVSYDISDNKKRTRFSKYLLRFGRRLQFSVFEIENSEKILNNIVTDVNNRFLKEFDQSDSVYIFKLTGSCQIMRFGYAANEDDELVVIK